MPCSGCAERETGVSDGLEQPLPCRTHGAANKRAEREAEMTSKGRTRSRRRPVDVVAAFQWMAALRICETRRWHRSREGEGEMEFVSEERATSGGRRSKLPVDACPSYLRRM